MQFHIAAFAPFAVLCGVALTAGAVSFLGHFVSAKDGWGWGFSAPAALGKAQRSAEIIPFPSPIGRQAVRGLQEAKLVRKA